MGSRKDSRSTRKGVGRRSLKTIGSRCRPLVLCSIKTQRLHSMKCSEGNRLKLLENRHAHNELRGGRKMAEKGEGEVWWNEDGGL